MRKLGLSLSCILFISITGIKAQSNVGIVGGAHNASISPDYFPPTQSSTATPCVGVHFGFMANIPFSYKSMFAFQPGVYFSGKGSKFQSINNNGSNGGGTVETIEQKLNYVEVPFNVAMKLPISKTAKFFIGGGPQASLFYNGTLSTTSRFEDGSVKLSENKDLPVGRGDQKYAIIHAGVNGLAGFELGRLLIMINYNTSLTPFYQENGKEFKHQAVGASLGFLFGKQEHQKQQKAKIKDSDKDGIPDSEDACPLKAGSALTKGCPDRDGDGIPDKDDRCPEAAGTIKNNGCPILDRDNDGIPDNEDQCPDIPGTIKYKGCPIPDSDRDGVNDELDKCPSIAGPKENDGCPVEDKSKPVFEEKSVKIVSYVAQHLKFEFQKASLLPASFKVLNQVVSLMKEHPELKITVEGHTSGEGNEEANKYLSKERANAVRQYLIKKGIAAERITAVGYGSARPLTKDKTPEEVAKNRRVEIKINK
ncbi:MAG: OmpA family protein [Flavisolibacter sp.]|nr:OmpA family protein [Flavisolibacter sp.]